ncbi:38.7k [Clostera anastomosis granulovirus B]|uniref:38.7k n=1 Tax=Clostera anastomosis granulovirus B TaxID=1986290 RepID=A0A0K0WS81_9BBAC|nr:38.7k [Clostera anastomosis granulovirus B]AKS25401.1 38.7k [Clostera anastomosis granulovirus B]
MNSWLNSVFDYLFGERFNEIKRLLDQLTQRVNYLYTNVYHKNYDYEDDDILEEEDYEEEDWSDKDRSYNNEYEDNDHHHHDHEMYNGNDNLLNFGVFVKQRLNNHTQLQFVSGSKDSYKTKSSLYTDMTKVVELFNFGSEYEVKTKQLKTTLCLEAAGLNVTHISENSKIVKGHIDDVIRIIKDD